MIFLLPLTVASVAAAISWAALLNTSQGWVNYYLGLLHLPQPNWLASSSAAMPSVIITDMWSGVPVVAVIVLAALIGAPRDPIEAAMVDGASAWNRFRYVTFPAIMPALVLAALLRTVAAFQQFALFEVLTGGGPGLSTTVINFYVYQQDHRVRERRLRRGPGSLAGGHHGDSAAAPVRAHAPALTPRGCKRIDAARRLLRRQQRWISRSGFSLKSRASLTKRPGSTAAARCARCGRWSCPPSGPA